MIASEIAALRTKLGLNQTQFGALMGVHAMTVSRWERAELAPTPYQVAFMTEYKKGAENKKIQETFSSVLVGVGIVAAVMILLTAAKEGE
jgi:DNA-binding transcriptional regulator YiaG